MAEPSTFINGIDVAQLRGYIEACRRDPARADRDPVVVGRWLGGTRAEVAAVGGGPAVYMGGPADPSALGMLLRTLAACDIEVVANRAALLGVEIVDLSIEVAGHANVNRYLGLDGASGPGFERIEYTIRLTTRGATEEQLAQIRTACEEGSPVGDTLTRQVHLSLDFQAD